MAHHLGHPGDLVVEQGKQRLRSHVTRTEPRTSSEDEDIGESGAPLRRGANLVEVIDDALARDDVSGKERESRDDHISAAVVGVNAPAAVADGDLGGPPAVLRGDVTHRE